VCDTLASQGAEAQLKSRVLGSSRRLISHCACTHLQEGTDVGQVLCFHAQCPKKHQKQRLPSLVLETLHYILCVLAVSGVQKARHLALCKALYKAQIGESEPHLSSLSVNRLVTRTFARRGLLG